VRAPTVSRRQFDLPERLATPESVYLNRRALLRGAANTAGLGLGLAPFTSLASPARGGSEADPDDRQLAATRNPDFQVERPLTDATLAARYNNFYEFGPDKHIAGGAQRLSIDPWSIEVGGLVERPQRFDARWVRFESFHRPSEAWSQALRFWYPWPYTETLRMDEAMNELVLLATGIYGRPLPRQHGAPARLVVPWKYGFKSLKSLVRIDVVREPPATFWHTLQPNEYGLTANVDPEVSHPRWSQASERLLGTGDRYPTLPLNGYGRWVERLYEGA